MRIIYEVDDIMQHIAIIQEHEEGKYSDIPRWNGWIESWTDKAVLLHIEEPGRTRQNQHWVPYSQLRKAEDGQSIYATLWILNKKGL